MLYILGILFFIGCLFLPLPDSWPDDRFPWWACFLIIIGTSFLVLCLVYWRVQARTKDAENSNQSIILWWSLSHILLHAALAFLCPSQWALWQACSFELEAMEYNDGGIFIFSGVKERLQRTLKDDASKKLNVQYGGYVLAEGEEPTLMVAPLLFGSFSS
jgi:hypothetical protein